MALAHALQLDTYKKNQFYTADKGTLLLMLYQGAIDFLRRAKDHLEKGQIADKGIYLSKAHAIIAELLSSLDFETGGDLARSLEALYRFMMELLMEAHLSNDVKAIDDVLSLLLTLQEGWEGAVAQARKEGSLSHD
jgi:flagellar secretion chaperone FliS